jgi:hypothetical protein
MNDAPLDRSPDFHVDPEAEDRLVDILRHEGFFRRRKRRTWLTAAAASLVFFALGVATGVRIAGREAPAVTIVEPAQPSPESPSQTQGVIWF